MSRAGPGFCPFAEQIEGVTTFDTGGGERVGFCDHTASGFYTTLTSRSFWNNAGVSVHFAIARDGRIAQLINIFDTAFAQGRDSRGQPVGPNSPGVTWPPFAEMARKNPNGYLISTEHEDYEMNPHGQPRPIPNAEWTPEEYAADLKVKRWCVEEIAEHTGKPLLRFGIDSLAGHYMFDPVNRAECPGKSWRESYRAMLYDELTKAAPGPRVWAWGNEVAGCEIRGSQLFYWHNGIEIDAVGDYEGKLPGAHYHHAGDDENGKPIWVEVLR